MSEEVKEHKRINLLGEILNEFRLTTGMLLLIVCCVVLIVWSTFVQIDITHFIIPKGFFTGEKLAYKDFLYTYTIIPQIPVVMFIGALMGRKYGIMCVLFYILLGLFAVPIFAVGGGPKYVLEYGFGYILGYIPAVFFAGSILQSGFSNRNIIHAALVGVLTIHIIGVLYMLFIAGLRHEGWTFVQGWIVSQSGIKVVYDFLLSFATIFVAKYAKVLYWIYD